MGSMMVLILLLGGFMREVTFWKTIRVNPSGLILTGKHS
jgi:hypothetical protein